MDWAPARHFKSRVSWGPFGCQPHTHTTHTHKGVGVGGSRLVIKQLSSAPTMTSYSRCRLRSCRSPSSAKPPAPPPLPHCTTPPNLQPPPPLPPPGHAVIHHHTHTHAHTGTVRHHRGPLVRTERAASNSTLFSELRAAPRCHTTGSSSQLNPHS